MSRPRTNLLTFEAAFALSLKELLFKQTGPLGLFRVRATYPQKDKGVGKLQPAGQIQTLPVFLNKVLLEHSGAQLFTNRLWLLLALRAKWSSWNRPLSPKPKVSPLWPFIGYLNHSGVPHSQAGCVLNVFHSDQTNSGGFLGHLACGMWLQALEQVS